MAKRRANGEGSAHQRANGQWDARLSYLDPDTGKRKRISVRAATRKAALDKLDDVRDRLNQGKPPKDATTTVADWLAHWRATTLAVSDRAESTKEQYAMLSRVHLETGPFGTHTLDKVKPSDVERLILDMRSATKPGKPQTDADTEPEPVRKYADSTIRTIYTILRAGLDGAVRDGLLARNPAALVKRPGLARREAKHLPAADVVALVEAARNSRYHTALVLIATTGLRKGEALALKWEHVDLDARTIKITGTMGRIGGQLRVTEPKTARSRRTVPLTPAMAALLKRHRVTQAEERLHAGNQWAETGLVFTTEFGTAVDPRNLLRVIDAAARSLGLSDVGVHTLRHSAGTAWLESGVHIKAVADLLGHSSIAVTGDIYGHTSDSAARAAVDGLSTQLGL